MTGRIIVATDGSDTGNRAIDFAASLSDKLDSDLTVVHVLLHGRPPKEFIRLAEVEGLAVPSELQRPPGGAPMNARFPDPAAELATERAVMALGEHILKLARERAEGAGARNVETEICAGDIADEILDIAEADKAGMIVMGRRGLGRVREALLGSVSQKVLHHADCTVIIVQ